jgi:hypothetical protein
MKLAHPAVSNSKIVETTILNMNAHPLRQLDIMESAHRPTT